jgi:hypothetical protein
MKDQAKVEISLSKAKLAKLLSFSILFVVAGLWLIIAQPTINNPVFNNFFVKTIAAYGATVMGLLGTCFFTKKLFDSRPGIIIDSDGITDNSGALSVGLIPWHDIDEVYEGTVQASLASKERFVTIRLKNPEEYILKQANPIQRKLMSLNARSYGSPIHISTNGLRIKHADLLQLIKENLEAYKQEHVENTKHTTEHATFETD